MHIVLIGNTGSGKTTLGKALSDTLGIPLVSSGSIARDLSETDPSTDLALKQGALAPEQAMRHAIKTRIEQEDLNHGSWILDGFPRSIAQLICLQQWSSAMPVFLVLMCEPWTCIERLVDRGRDDDNPDAIARKLASYERDTKPLIDMLPSFQPIYSEDTLEAQVQAAKSAL